jgi:hypothetical protein
MSEDPLPIPEPGKPDPYAPKIPVGFLEGLKKTIFGRMRNGRKTHHVPIEDKPNRFCRICTRTWISKIILAGNDLQPGICEGCQKELDEGRIAVIVPNTTKHCFVYSAALAASMEPGQEPIIEVSEEVFGYLKAEFTINKQKEN